MIHTKDELVAEYERTTKYYVVHTLPLPPPRSKGMSELITYTSFYNTS